MPSPYLYDPSSPEAIKIRSLGGDPMESSLVRSAAFASGLASMAPNPQILEGLRASDPVGFRRLNDRYDRARRMQQIAQNQAGIGQSGVALEELLTIEQDRSDALIGNEQKRRSGGQVGDGSDFVIPNSPAAPVVPGGKFGSRPLPGTSIDIGRLEQDPRMAAVRQAVQAGRDQERRRRLDMAQTARGTSAGRFTNLPGGGPQDAMPRMGDSTLFGQPRNTDSRLAPIHAAMDEFTNRVKPSEMGFMELGESVLQSYGKARNMEQALRQSRANAASGLPSELDDQSMQSIEMGLARLKSRVEQEYKRFVGIYSGADRASTITSGMALQKAAEKAARHVARANYGNENVRLANGLQAWQFVLSQDSGNELERMSDQLARSGNSIEQIMLQRQAGQ